MEARRCGCKDVRFWDPFIPEMVRAPGPLRERSRGRRGETGPNLAGSCVARKPTGGTEAGPCRTAWHPDQRTKIQLAEPALNPRERARLRAEIDAIVSGLYDLSPAEFAHILTTFPLPDRGQPPLTNDFFVRWDKQDKPKPEPRSYVTRDTALLAKLLANFAIAASPRPMIWPPGIATKSM